MTTLDPNNGGSGYVVGDVVTVSAGTFTRVAKGYVNAVKDVFTVTSANATAGAVYSNNGSNFTVRSMGY